MAKGSAGVHRNGLADSHRRLVAAVRRMTGSKPPTDFDSDVWTKIPSPEELEGAAPAGLWNLLAAQVESAGFELRRGWQHGNDGFTDGRARIVWIADDISDAQACATLAHELAHVLLHCGRDCTGREVEVEAESVAFLVCHACGLATDASTVPYLALWSGADARVVKDAGSVVLATARTILASKAA